MGKEQKTYLLILLSLLAGAGCHEMDTLLVPINNATVDLNHTKENFSMPTELFPGAKIHLKGSKLAIEKHF